MKIMTYNIMDGGYSEVRDRTPLILDTIRAASPDIVGLCEAAGFDQAGGARLRYYRDQLGMTAFMNAAPSGSHVALLYRPNLEVVDRHADSPAMYHGFAQITVESALGLTSVFMAHLHPYSSWYRVTEAQTLAAKGLAAGHAIVMGDMNAIAASDLPIDASAIPAHRVARLAGSDGLLDTTVVDTFLNRGYVDLGATGGTPTYPTAIKTDDANREEMLRLDYMFATAEVAQRQRTFSVIDGEMAQRASDHLPLVAEIDI